jgi:hypothetical protein
MGKNRFDWNNLKKKLMEADWSPERGFAVWGVWTPVPL